MTNIEPRAGQKPVPLQISHVASFYRRYPGERVTFYTRLDVDETLSGLTVRITLPAGLVLEAYRSPSYLDGALPAVEREGDVEGVCLVWHLAETSPPGSYEYQVTATVAPTECDRTLESRAVVTLGGADGRSISTEQVATVVVLAKGRYLEYLPALYQKDELMGRFLMLFESFWSPIEGQIEALPFYFDPLLTPPDFLPWLASWLDLALDERWPEQRRRQLLRSAASLYQKRGTKQGLQTFLEIYTGEKAQIVEHRAHDFCLGPRARLGPGIALGTGNAPYTFTVVLALPPLSSAKGEDERDRQELERRRMIEAIIEAEKPAHTRYTLCIKVEREA